MIIRISESPSHPLLTLNVFKRPTALPEAARARCNFQVFFEVTRVSLFSGSASSRRHAKAFSEVERIVNGHRHRYSSEDRQVSSTQTNLQTWLRLTRLCSVFGRAFEPFLNLRNFCMISDLLIWPGSQRRAHRSMRSIRPTGTTSLFSIITVQFPRQLAISTRWRPNGTFMFFI
jgi:hypothetical protein